MAGLEGVLSVCMTLSEVLMLCKVDEAFDVVNSMVLLQIYLFAEM